MQSVYLSPSSYTRIEFPEGTIGSGSVYRAEMPSAGQVKLYKEKMGISTVVQLCEDQEFENYKKGDALSAYSAHGLNHIKFPIKDGNVPLSTKETRKLTKQIIQLAKDGHNILIHDLGGKGRTALILACLARKIFGYEAGEGMEFAKSFIPAANFSKIHTDFLKKLFDKEPLSLSSAVVTACARQETVEKRPARPLTNVSSVSSRPRVEKPVTLIPLPEDEIGLGKIYRCKLPTPKEVAEYKHNYGISTVVTLCKSMEFYGEYEKTLLAYNEHRIKVIPFPIQDYKIPDPEEMSSLLSDILEETRKGKNVLIHCFAGHGRTGLVLACLTGLVCNQKGEGAIAYIKKLIPEALKTPIQQDFVMDFLEGNRIEYGEEVSSGDLTLAISMLTLSSEEANVSESEEENILSPLIRSIEQFASELFSSILNKYDQF